MTSHSKQPRDWVMDAFVILLAASIPFGLCMAFYMDDSRWLWFCAPLLIFLS